MTASLDFIAWPVTTKRLTLRRLTEGDLESTWSYRKLPEVTEWVTAGPKDFETYRTQFLEPGKTNRDIAVELSDGQGGSRLIGPSWSISRTRGASVKSPSKPKLLNQNSDGALTRSSRAADTLPKR